GALVLNNTASSVQLAMTGTGVWTAAGDIAGNISKFFRSEERRVGKECVLIGVDLGGRRIIKKGGGGGGGGGGG
ncbi:hypothetical protein, partial [Escherichia coli]